MYQGLKRYGWQILAPRYWNRKKPVLMSEEKTSLHNNKIRLHLGCGHVYLEGYVNIDSGLLADSLGDEAHRPPDLHMDFMDIGEIYPKGSVAEVLMIHSLCYVRFWQAKELFYDIYRLLELGGRLSIEECDLTKCAKTVLKHNGKEQLDQYLEAVRAIYAFAADWTDKKVMYTPYSFGWSAWHLKLELERAGFQKVIIRDPLTHGRRIWRDMRVEAIK